MAADINARVAAAAARAAARGGKADGHREPCRPSLPCLLDRNYANPVAIGIRELEAASLAALGTVWWAAQPASKPVPRHSTPPFITCTASTTQFVAQPRPGQ